TSTDVYRVKIQVDGTDTPYVAFFNPLNDGYVLKFNGVGWDTIGGTKFNGFTAISSISLAIDSATSTPYVASRGLVSNKFCYIKKFDGSNWVQVGSIIKDVSTGTEMDIDLSTTGVPYVIYSDENQSYRATVLRFNGTQWDTVGIPGFSVRAGTVEIKLDRNNVPYAACYDYSASLKVYVYRFNGTNWVTVGSPQGVVSTGSPATFPLLTFDAANTPYLSYRDNVNFNSIKKFNVTDWVDVNPYLPFLLESAHMGIAADSAGGIYTLRKETALTGSSNFLAVRKYKNNTGSFIGDKGITDVWSDFYDMSSDNNGTPYITYVDKYKKNQVSVKKYDGSNWVHVGPLLITDTPAYVTKIAVNTAGEPHVSYIIHDTLFVKKYNGTSWVQVGTYVDASIANITTFLIDSRDSIWICYLGQLSSYRPVVKKFDGTNWQLVGSAGFTNFNATAMAIDNNGTPYVSAIEQYRATVYKFNGSSWVTVGSPQFSYNTTVALDIAIDTGNIPHVVYSDGTFVQRLKVKKFDGANWVPVGDTNFAAHSTGLLKLRFDSGNTPYVAFGISTQRIMRYNGASWTDISMDGYRNLATHTNKRSHFALIPAANRLFLSTDLRAYHMYSASLSSFCDRPDSAHAINIGSAGATVKFKPTGGVSGYEYILPLSPNPILLPVTTGDSITLTGLTPNSSQEVWLRSRCNGDSSVWVKVLFNTTNVCMPAQDTIKNITDTSISLAWNIIANADGYEYEVSNNATPSLGTFTTDSTKHIGGLAPNTLYFVHLRTICGIDTTSWLTKQFTTTSVHDVAIGTFFKVSPNPAEELLTVYIGNTNKHRGATLTFTDMTGHVIKVEPIDRPVSVLDISMLPKGIYIMQFRVEGTQQFLRLVKN
ncbi:MAG: T9SS type A sorting domain-containing protein, partial [Taibaiella sp.]|nr:T9SS type A sorting domain-containing protein [Taibaiella sp.]